MMSSSISSSNDFHFLAGGGEMGSLIRATDWSQTPLGEPAAWPQCLRTIIAIMLDNPFGMYVAWGDEYIQLYNDGYRPILGESKHPKALGISSRETFEEIWHIIGPMFGDVMKGKAVGFPDFMLPLNRSGFVEECYFDFSYSPIRTEDGTVGGVLVTVIETTNKKRAEEALRESEERFRTMAEGATILIATSDDTSKADYFNKAWTEFTGRSMAELIDYGWADLLHEEDRQEFLNRYLEAFSNKEPWTGEFRMLNQAGNYRWLLANGTARFHANNSFAGYVSSSIDIHDRKLAERAVHEKEQNLRNTILQAPVAMCIFRGPDHVVELANERMFEFWGKPREAVLNKPIFEGLPEAKDQGFETLLNGVYSTGKTFTANGVPVTLPRKDRIEVVYVNFVYEAYREADGSISGILAVAVDVTEQVMAHQKIEEKVAERTQELATVNKNLEKSNAELAQFAHIASHDLQEPLRKIGVFSEMLEHQISANLDEKSRGYLSKINTAASRMTTLIRDVLSYSEVVKENEVFEPVDLNDVLESIKVDYEMLIQQKGATIRSEKLPVISAIPIQIAQLFGNLLGNALKFTKPDLPPQIEIKVKRVEGSQLDKASLDKSLEYYRISFTDNGIGFNQSQGEKIFNIFHRLHRKAEYEGTGIGLAMCKKIALNHNGDLNADGSTEAGAVFNVLLPDK